MLRRIEAAMEDGAPHDQHDSWINQRIHEGINSALAPIQEQLAALLQRVSGDEAGQSSERLQVPNWNAASSEAGGTNTPRTVAAPYRKPLPNPSKFSGLRREYAAW